MNVFVKQLRAINMKSVFEIYRENGIPFNINLKDFIEDNFIFIDKLDKEIIDQMSAEEIYNHDSFFNNDWYFPLPTLFKHDKITVKAFSHIMNKKLSGLKIQQEVFEEYMNFIKKHNIDVGQFFYKNSIAPQMKEFLAKYEYIDYKAIFKNLNLKKAIENESIALLIFGFKTNEGENEEALLDYICENFEVLSNKFLKNWSINGIVNYFKSETIGGCEYYDNPISVLATSLASRYRGQDGILTECIFNEVLIDAYIQAVLDIDAMYASEIIKKIENRLPETYKKYSKYVKHQNQSIDLTSADNFIQYLETCDHKERREIVLNIDNYITLNKNDFNYRYYEMKYYHEYSEKFMMLYLNAAIEAYENNGDIMKNYRWNGFITRLVLDIMYLVSENSTYWKNVFERAISCDLFVDYIINYVQDNGSLVTLNLINDTNPELLKKFDHDKLLHSIIINSK